MAKTNYFTTNKIIKWALIATLLVMLAIIISYFYTFRGGLSDKHQHWGEFGSLFASITGLIAFVGVLWTIYDNNKNHKKSEERSDFFSFLQLFRDTKNNVSLYSPMITKEIAKVAGKSEFDLIKGQDALDNIADYGLMCLGEQFYKSLPDNLCAEDVLDFFNNKISKDVSKQIKAKFEQIKNEKQSGCYSHVNIMNNNTEKNLNKESMKVLFDYFIAHNLYEPIAQTFYNTGNFLITACWSAIGDYSRNVHYMLENFNSYEGNNIYTQLFRSQLSQEELIVIFLNSFSYKSSKEVRENIKRYDLFNNFRFYQIGLVIEETTKPTIMKNLYNALEAIMNKKKSN